MVNTSLLLENQVIITTEESRDVLQNINVTPTSRIAAISASPGLVYVSYITLPIILAVGLCGNSLTVIVSRSKTYRTTCHGILITAMAANDFLYILTIPFSGTYVFKLFGEVVRAYTPAGCSIYYLFWRGGKICSASLVVLICLERFILTWFPLRARKYINKRAAVISVSINVFAVGCFCGVWSSVANVEDNKCIGVALTSEKQQMAKICSLIGMTWHSFIPTAVLLCFTPLTIFKIFYQRTARRRVQSNKSSQDSGPDEAYLASMMLLDVIFAYLFLVTPFCLSRHALMLQGVDIRTLPELWAKNLDTVASICQDSGCIVNFFLYCLLSPSFRTRLRALFNGNASQSSTSIKSDSRY